MSNVIFKNEILSVELRNTSAKGLVIVDLGWISDSLTVHYFKRTKNADEKMNSFRENREQIINALEKFYASKEGEEFLPNEDTRAYNVRQLREALSANHPPMKKTFYKEKAHIPVSKDVWVKPKKVAR